MARPEQQQTYFKPVKIVNTQAGVTIITLENGDKIKLGFVVKGVYQHMMPDKKTPMMNAFGKFIYSPESEITISLEPAE